MNRSRASPPSTQTLHACVLRDDGAQRASSRISRTRLSGTGSGVYARMLLRPRMTLSNSMTTPFALPPAAYSPASRVPQRHSVAAEAGQATEADAPLENVRAMANAARKTAGPRTGTMLGDHHRQRGPRDRRRDRGAAQDQTPSAEGSSASRPAGLKLIACPAVLGELADGATDGVDTHKLEAQLHLSPERLKAALAAAVAEADEPGATIVLGYGLCSNSVLGLKTEHATLVVPKVDDCIAMLLGSNEAFAAENARGARLVLRRQGVSGGVRHHRQRAREARGEARRRARREDDAPAAAALHAHRAHRHRQIRRGAVPRPRGRVRRAVRPGGGGRTRHHPDPRCAGGGRAGATTSSSPLPATSSTLEDFRPELFGDDAAQARRPAHGPAAGARGRRHGAGAKDGAGGPRMRLLVIAGFLGSGKTTVLLDLARRLTDDGYSLAIVENEIGEIGVDGEVVRRHGLPVRELFGGCICCTLQVGLVETLRDIETEFAPDYAVVEPTGLAAPGDVVATVRGLMPSLESITTLTLVDAERWEMLWEVVEPLVTAQVEAADVVVVNKADAAGAEATAAARDSGPAAQPARRPCWSPTRPRAPAWTRSTPQCGRERWARARTRTTIGTTFATSPAARSRRCSRRRPR